MPMDKRLYLMQGVPGSGKSVMANFIMVALGHALAKYDYFSTDTYRFTDEGVYVYDPETNRHFHTMCQKDVIEAMQNGVTNIIVDNTNITQQHADPYLTMARIFDYEVQVVRVETNLKLAVARQAERREDRAVPEGVIQNMYDTMERLVV
jgi:predicted kinase